MDWLAYTLDDFSIPWFPMDCKLWLSNHACHCPARFVNPNTLCSLTQKLTSS